MNIRACFVWILILNVLLSSCAGGEEQRQHSTLVATQLPTKIQFTATPVVTPTTSVSSTNTPQLGSWTVLEHWTPANQIRTMMIDRSGDLWAGGPAGLVHWDRETGKPTIYALRDNPAHTNIVSLAQTPDNAIWAGTFGNGLARFDGMSWQPLTTEDGLPGNFVISHTMTPSGELWFGLQDDKHSQIEDTHLGRLDGNEWIMKAGAALDRIAALSDGTIVGTYNFPYHGGFFQSSVGIYDGQKQKWNRVDIYPDGWIDAITVAPDGVVWFATHNTIYRYVNQKWIKIVPPWAKKDFPRISSIAISADGVAWFGFALWRWEIDQCGTRDDNFEEKGVYRYDGKTWTHFTTEDGLVDNKICAIALDADGNPWFGSFDKGISHFDGQTWKTYVIP